MDKPQTARSSDIKQLLTVLVVFFACVAVALAYSFVRFSSRANFRQVVSDKVYRSAQPSSDQLREWVGRYGIRTVINLRGKTEEITQKENDLASDLGLNMISVRLSSKKPPAGPLLIELINAIETANQPMLIHCRSGIERTGVASTLAAMCIGNLDYDTAKWHAYVPPGPWKRRKWRKRKYDKDYSHVSDMLRSYERYCRRNELDTAAWKQFRQWAVGEDYLPQ